MVDCDCIERLHAEEVSGKPFEKWSRCQYSVCGTCPCNDALKCSAWKIWPCKTEEGNSEV